MLHFKSLFAKRLGIGRGIPLRWSTSQSVALTGETGPNGRAEVARFSEAAFPGLHGRREQARLPVLPPSNERKRTQGGHRS